MNIARIRRARGLTQVQLAEMADVTQPTLSRAENLDDGATLGTYKAIARALNVKLADLFTEDRAVVEQILVDAFRSLTPGQQQGWEDMAKVVLSDQLRPDQGTPRTDRRSSTTTSP